MARLNLQKKKKGITPGYGPNLQTIYGNRSIVEVDKAKGTIVLLLDPENPFAGKISGSLELTDDIKEFGINGNKEYNRVQLVKLLRFSKRYFETPEKHEKVLTAFQGLEAKISVELADKSDNRGNKEAMVKTVAQNNLPNDFILQIPVFKGIEPFKFRVEICFDYTEGGFTFWFESPELKELIDAKKEEIFKEQLKACEGLVIVNK